MTISATYNDSPTSPGYDLAISGLAQTLNANPFFETNATNWTGNGGTVSRSTAQFHEGVAAGLLTPGGVQNTVGLSSEHVTGILPNVVYRFIVWVRSAVTRNVTIFLDWYDAGDVFINQVPANMTVTANTWTQMTVAEVSPSNVSRAAVRLEIFGSPAPTSSELVYIDEAILRRDFSYYKVIRRDLSGFLPDVDVRKAGADPDGLIPTGGSDTAAVSDYEFSFNTNIQYRLELYDLYRNLQITQTTTVGFPVIPTTAYYGHAWLKDIYTPANSRPIVVGEFRSYSKRGRTTSFDVLGRANPVIITDVISGKEGSLTFYALDPGLSSAVYPYDDYDTLFAPGTTLYFSSLFPQQTGWKDFYLVVNSVEFERLSLASANAETVFRYTIGFAEVDMPATTSIDTSAQTWQMVLDNHTNWQDVLNSHTNWLDVYTDPQDLT